MGLGTYLLAILISAVITTFELSGRGQRHPFQDRFFKAAGWWLAVVALDGAVAVALLVGAIQSKALNQSLASGAGNLGVGLAVGALGPLALRSPIRETTVKRRDAKVGLTYFYDIARLYALFALDERLVVLKRRDVLKMRQSWASAGWTSELVIDQLKRHIDDHNGLTSESRSRITRQIRSVKTLQTEEDRLDGTIKIMRTERFTGLIDEVSSRGPSTEQDDFDQQAGTPAEDVSEAVPGAAESTSSN